MGNVVTAKQEWRYFAAKDLINKKYKDEMRILRGIVYHHAMIEGESLMPEDVARLMQEEEERWCIVPSILTVGFMSQYGVCAMLKEIYESCGFVLPENTSDIDILLMF